MKNYFNLPVEITEIVVSLPSGFFLLFSRNKLKICSAAA